MLINPTCLSFNRYYSINGLKIYFENNSRMGNSVKGVIMNNTNKKNDSDCREYCEPVHRACLKVNDTNEPCDEKLNECLSFCAFA